MKITKNQLRELIRQSIKEESAGSKQAKKLGLKSKGFGNYEDPKSGERYSTRSGKLQKVDSTSKKKGKPSLGTSIANKIQKQKDKYNKRRKEAPKGQTRIA